MTLIRCLIEQKQRIILFIQIKIHLVSLLVSLCDCLWFFLVGSKSVMEFFLIIEMVNDSPVSGSWALNPRAGGRQKIGLVPDLSLVMSRNHLIGL